MTLTDPLTQQPPPALQCRDLAFRWDAQGPAIRYPDIELPQGEHLFLRGASGSGKSTLLSLICGLSAVQQGQLTLLGQDARQLSRGRFDRLRADRLGVIFQQFNLVPYLSPLANTLLPCRLSARRRQRTAPSAQAEAEALLAALAIPTRHWHRPVTELSVGQQQRVAAARALIGSPALILADEPTSALDRENRDRFIQLLLTQANSRQTSVLLVSHDDTLARNFATQLTLGDCP
ncbi:MAG: ATP-binding cassette domain-containing protein [Marinobacter sp.]|uniref:ATP-binding cassette domain-containing protein n=1 Tax=Marinobacter sp. TaxID=50741 RepID=UPI00299ED6EB|nr:ATP-binding cassette domain-containing protein [Marinobacter sp.]MDX1756849.1 ATP-binding cassette domain-containing protein [Marinobacter sp.]